PIAAASVGQVHRARLPSSGEWVAVKIQYPGIEEVMRRELQQLAAFAWVMRLFLPGQVDAMEEEVRSRFLEECDYTVEASNMNEFIARFLPATDIRIPAAHREYSTRRILTMDWMDGANFEEFARCATAVERDRVGTTILKFFYE